MEAERPPPPAPTTEMVLDPRAGNGFLLGLKTCGLAGLQLGHRVTGLRFQVGISCLREMVGETLPLGSFPHGGWLKEEKA